MKINGWRTENGFVYLQANWFDMRVDAGIMKIWRGRGAEVRLEMVYQLSIVQGDVETSVRGKD